MRIGELLIACDLITPKQLSAGLEYARSKGLPIGRVLRLLRYLDETNLEIALLGQRCIRSGMDAEIVVTAAKDAIRSGKPFEEVLKAQAITAAASPMLVLQPFSSDPSSGKNAGQIVELADEALNEDRLQDAEKLYKLAVDRFEQAQPVDAIQLAYACSRQAAFYLLTDRWDESEQLYLSVVALREQKLGTEDISVARAYMDLADLYDVWDKFDSSVEYALKACSILHGQLPAAFDEFYGPLRKLDAFAKKLGQAPRRKTGEILVDTGMLSESNLQTALHQGKQTNRPLGSVLKQDGLLAEQDLQSILSAQLLMKEGMLSEEIAIEALKVARKMGMPLRAVIDHFKLLVAGSDDDALAELVLEQERLVGAESVLGVDHPEVASVAHNLANKYFQRNSIAEAELLLKRVLAIEALSAGVPADVVGKTCELMATIYYKTGRELLAAPLLLRALESLSRSGETQSERGVAILAMLGDVEMKQQNFAGAVSFLRSVVAVAEQVYGPADAETAKHMERLADAYAEIGSTEQAQALYIRCMQVHEYALNAVPGATAAVANKLAKLHSP